MIGDFDSSYFSFLLKEKNITSKKIAELINENEEFLGTLSEESIKKYR